MDRRNLVAIAVVQAAATAVSLGGIVLTQLLDQFDNRSFRQGRTRAFAIRETQLDTADNNPLFDDGDVRLVSSVDAISLRADCDSLALKPLIERGTTRATFTLRNYLN